MSHGNASEAGVGIRFPNEYSISLVIKAIGTGATVTAIGKIIEEEYDEDSNNARTW